jgi:hypothetical protein
MKKGSRGTLLVPLFTAVVIAVYLVLVAGPSENLLVTLFAQSPLSPLPTPVSPLPTPAFPSLTYMPLPTASPDPGCPMPPVAPGPEWPLEPVPSPTGTPPAASGPAGKPVPGETPTVVLMPVTGCTQ